MGEGEGEGEGEGPENSTMIVPMVALVPSLRLARVTAALALMSC